MTQTKLGYAICLVSLDRSNWIIYETNNAGKINETRIHKTVMENSVPNLNDNYADKISNVITIMMSQ